VKRTILPTKGNIPTDQPATEVAENPAKQAQMISECLKDAKKTVANSDKRACLWLSDASCVDKSIRVVGPADIDVNLNEPEV